ncbi:MAG TPA: NAD-dependent epimerase/dehydratase family protein [Deinococcales bacterium]|nr:NAD-dependent epimerase/dehydratase family protein [Deinococcales bacterium]
MSVCVVTGSAGLIGSEAARFFASIGMHVVGVDNDMRARFFGADASTRWNRNRLEGELGSSYEHVEADIRDEEVINRLFERFGGEVSLVVHTAAQPSHDWAARDPMTDFTVNANGTLVLLQAARTHCPDAVFIFTSTNKVYGDLPNYLPLVEKETRWEIEAGHPYERGILEDMSIDQSKHSLFGASKVAADVLVQEYGRYFGMRTVCFRGGTLTGPGHSGTELHGFLSYLMKCTMTGKPYTVFGYKAKQVRDAIHSKDLISAFHEFFKAPRVAEVYNMGGGRYSECSMLEAISECERISGHKLNWTYSDQNRQGDHIWYVSGLEKFEAHYPQWRITYDVPAILQEIFEANQERWSPEVVGA